MKDTSNYSKRSDPVFIPKTPTHREHVYSNTEALLTFSYKKDDFFIIIFLFTARKGLHLYVLLCTLTVHIVNSLSLVFLCSLHIVTIVVQPYLPAASVSFVSGSPLSNCA